MLRIKRCLANYKWRKLKNMKIYNTLQEKDYRMIIEEFRGDNASLRMRGLQTLKRHKHIRHRMYK